MNDSKKSGLSYEFFLKEGERLNLLTRKRYKNILILMKRGLHAPEHEELLLSMIKARELELLAVQSPCPPPTPEQANQGPYRIGTTVESGSGNPVTYPSTPVNFLVLGKQNTGKTRGASLFALQEIESSTVLIIESRHDFEYLFRYVASGLYLDAATAPFNFFEPDPGLPFEKNSGETINTLGQYQTLFHRGMSVLQIAAKGLKEEGKAVTAGRLLRFLRNNKKQFSHNTDAYYSSIDRLEALVDSFPGWNVEKGLTSPDLLNHRFLYVDTSPIPRVDFRITFIALLLKRLWLWQERHSPRRNQTEVLVIIDEAEYLFMVNLFKGQYAGHFLQDLLRQGRAIGIQLVLIMHQVKDIDHAVLANAGNLMAFRMTEMDDQRRVANALGFPPNAAQFIGSLANRHCFVRFDSGYTKPFLMKTLDFDVNDQPLTSEERKAILARQSHLLTLPPADPPPERVIPSSAAKPSRAPVLPEIAPWVPDHNTTNLLHAVHNHGFKGVTKVYESAGISATTGRERLIDLNNKGLVGSHKLGFPGRGGQRTTVFLTKAGRVAIGAPAPRGVGGDDHTAYQKEFQFGLTELGFEAQIEKTVDGKAVDIAFRMVRLGGNTDLIAAEIDLTTDPIENARKDLIRGFAEIYLIVPGNRIPTLLNKIEEEFSAGEQKRLHLVEPKNFLREAAKLKEQRK